MFHSSKVTLSGLAVALIFMSVFGTRLSAQTVYYPQTSYPQTYYPQTNQQPQIQYQKQPQVQPQDVVLMAIGGWGSCGLNRDMDTQYIAAQLRNMQTQLERNLPLQIKVHVVSICSPHVLKSAYGNRTLEYRISQTIQRFSNGTKQLQNQSDQVQESNVAALLATVQQRFGSPLIYVIGHSHGGYTGMKAVAASPIQVRGLYTIEPIDASQCNTRKFFRNRRGLRQVQACRQAPRMAYSAYSQIAMNSQQNWNNYTFQHRRGTDNGELYSSAIPNGFAKEHTLSLFYGDDSHHMAGIDTETWTRIYQQVSQNLGMSQYRYQGLAVDHEGRPATRMTNKNLQKEQRKARRPRLLRPGTWFPGRR